MTPRAPLPMPYVPGLLIRHLLDHKNFTELLHGGEVSTRTIPDPLTRPHVTIKTIPGAGGDDPMLRTFLVQITPWAPSRETSGIDEDPEVTVWNLAATAGEILGRARNVVLDERHAWTTRWVEGPFNLDDTEQGIDRPVYYAPIRIRFQMRRR